MRIDSQGKIFHTLSTLENCELKYPVVYKLGRHGDGKLPMSFGLNAYHIFKALPDLAAPATSRLKHYAVITHNA